MSNQDTKIAVQYREQVVESLKCLAEKLVGGSRNDSEAILGAVALLADQDAVFHRRLADYCYENLDWVGSVVHFTKCTMLNKDDYNAMFYLACAYKNMGRYNDAIVQYKSSLSIHEYPEGLLNLAATYSDINENQLEQDTLERLTTTFPNFTLGHYNYGIWWYDKRDISKSIKSFRNALETNPEHGESKVALSLALLMDKQYIDGFKMHEYRWGVSPNCPIREFNRPLWRGQDVAINSSILVTLEQGFGDTLQMLRYLPYLSDKFRTVCIEVQPQMHRLVKLAYPNVEVIVHGSLLPSTDFYCPIMSLPMVFGTTYQTIPLTNRYLEIAGDPFYHLVLNNDTRKKIGVCWRGGMLNPKMAHRSLTADAIKKLFEDDKYAWVSLVKDLPDNEREELRCSSGLIDLTSGLTDFYDTYQLVSGLDLVITVDTAVAHLAGAMGKPTIIILNEGYDWRWHIDDDTSAWYPQTRLLRSYKLKSNDALVPELLTILRKMFD